MRLFHIALTDDWVAAQRTGSYEISTLGRTLGQEGFIHASRADQWEGVRERFYAAVTERLTLLEIDTDRLDSEVREEEAGPGETETFPHIYGPINTAAVVETTPITGSGAPASPATSSSADAGQPGKSFLQLWLGEVVFRAVAGTLVLAAAMVVSFVLKAWLGKSAALVGLVVMLVLGFVVAARWSRRRDQRMQRPA